MRLVIFLLFLFACSFENPLETSTKDLIGTSKPRFYLEMDSDKYYLAYFQYDKPSYYIFLDTLIALSEDTFVGNHSMLIHNINTLYYNDNQIKLRAAIDKDKYKYFTTNNFFFIFQIQDKINSYEKTNCINFLKSYYRNDTTYEELAHYTKPNIYKQLVYSRLNEEKCE